MNNPVKKLSSGTELHHQIDVPLVFIGLEQLDDMWVILFKYKPMPDSSLTRVILNFATLRATQLSNSMSGVHLRNVYDNIPVPGYRGV